MCFFAGFIEETYGIQIAFFDWMLIGLPLALVLLPLGWVVLTRVAFRVDVPASPGMRQMVMTSPERRVGLLFQLWRGNGCNDKSSVSDAWGSCFCLPAVVA